MKPKSRDPVSFAITKHQYFDEKYAVLLDLIYRDPQLAEIAIDEKITTHGTGKTIQMIYDESKIFGQWKGISFFGKDSMERDQVVMLLPELAYYIEGRHKAHLEMERCFELAALERKPAPQSEMERD